jgi:nitrite reductase (NADH) large subunit
VTERLVVVGNGMAANRVVLEVLARAPDRFEITVLGDEQRPAYNRVLLSGLLSGTEREADLALPVPAGVRVLPGTRATWVDRHRRLVHTGLGGPLPYDRLVLATGSRPRLPVALAPREGVRGVFCFRTLDDARRILRYARDARRAVVVGGGLLGLESARGLQARGLEVTVVHAATHLLDRQLDAGAGRVLAGSAARLGLTVLLGTRPTGLAGTDRVTGVRLAGGDTLPADLVVVATGVRPDTALAAAAGLPVERGVLVDDQLRTADPRVSALGDCAQHRGRVPGLADPAWDQARVLADQLTGADPAAAYGGSATVAKLKAAGLAAAAMGLPAPERDDDELVVLAEPSRGIHRSAVVRDGRLVGATLLGDVRRSAALLQMLVRGTPLPAERAALLVDFGGAVPAEVPVADLPDGEPICTCAGVTKGAVVAAVRGGLTGLGAVVDATRAGRGCGSCRPLLERVVSWAAGPPVRG